LDTENKKRLIGKLADKSARVAVIGIGYVGLPLMVTFAEAGFTVVGVDPDQRKVGAVNRGESYILDITNEQLAPLVKKGQVSATTDYSVVKDVQAVSICVPTPLRKTGDPDLSFIVSATESIAPYLHPGMVVVLESSTYPGTTRELVLPRLSETSHLTVGKDFFLAFSPERVDPGRKDFTTYNTPKVIGGITPACSEVANAFYSMALAKVVPVTSAEVAEMAKLLENTFRMINIGLVNEMALMCDRLGVDVWEVIDAAATKPFGFMKFTPGPGLGGHCIPIDPLYLSWKLRSLNYTARFIELASEINTQMPRFVVGKVQDALNAVKKPVKDSRILVLGVAYKPDIDDMRESPALDVIHLLKGKGADVVYHDPFVPAIAHDEWSLICVPNLMAEVNGADAVVIIDTRNALGAAGRDNPKVVRL
jgi:UDP-N-acetyl-D-glucosamine dehydrogenase